MKEKINDVLYEDCIGLFSKLRDGNYEKDEDQLNNVEKYVLKIVDDMKNNIFSKEDIVIVFTIIYSLEQYPEASWTTEFAWKLYNIVLSIED